jgi:serine/threonine protein kinase
MGLLKHENIVKFVDEASDDKHLVIIMELIEGTPLDEWLENRYSTGSSGVTHLEALPIVQQLIQGMAAVHALNIAHRDLKPGNLIFDDVTDKLVIVDFGLSKMHNANSTITRGTDPMGTLLYMSPEQIERDIKEISYPSDIWSIGIIWHEMLTNHTPFEPSAGRTEPGNSAVPGHGHSAVVATRFQRRTFSKKEERKMEEEVLKEGPRELKMLLSQPEKVPKAVTDTIAKCLNVNKKERFQDAQDLVNHLTGVLEELEKEREKQKDDEPQTPSKGKAKLAETALAEKAVVIEQLEEQQQQLQAELQHTQHTLARTCAAKDQLEADNAQVCDHTTIYLASAYYHMCPHTAICTSRP